MYSLKCAEPLRGSTAIHWVAMATEAAFSLFVCFLFFSFCHSSRGDSLGATFAGQPAQRKNGQQQLASPGRILSAREKDLEKSPQIQEAFQEPHY